jgi:hypothetical protein
MPRLLMLIRNFNSSLYHRITEKLSGNFYQECAIQASSLLLVMSFLSQNRICSVKFKIDKHSQYVFIDTCTTIIGRCQLREEAAKQTATRLEYQVRGLFHIAFEHLAMFHEDAASFLKEQKKIVSDPTISDSNKAVRIQEMRSAFSTDSLDSFNSEKIAGAISRAVESSVRSIQNISGAATTHELNFLTHYVNNSLVALLKDLKTRADEVRGYEEPRASTSFK